MSVAPCQYQAGWLLPSIPRFRSVNYSNPSHQSTLLAYLFGAHSLMIVLMIMNGRFPIVQGLPMPIPHAHRRGF
ncbi:hypothetical protein [uncultured Bifidobacterium sp.]|uniref:hypothetical protein n=1 Tax=uncultured Bifidobacterium sp. TaxID=165187 RepID=UPI0025D2CC07|nr:hypothetical protein [uncultured Bifidobacterium sp.]